MRYRSPYIEQRHKQRADYIAEVVTNFLIAALAAGLFLLAISRAEYIISIQ